MFTKFTTSLSFLEILLGLLSPVISFVSKKKQKFMSTSTHPIDSQRILSVSESEYNEFSAMRSWSKWKFRPFSNFYGCFVRMLCGRILWYSSCEISHTNDQWQRQIGKIVEWYWCLKTNSMKKKRQKHILLFFRFIFESIQ